MSGGCRAPQSGKVPPVPSMHGNPCDPQAQATDHITGVEIEQTYRGQLGGGNPDDIHQQEYHHPQSHPSPLGCRATLRAHPVHDEHPLHWDAERRNSETASLMTKQKTSVTGQYGNG